MKNAVRLLVAGAGLAMAASVVNAQANAAPASAQVWDVQFAVDTSGPFAQGPNATAVGITLRARVGIRPYTTTNTSSAGTRNFGVGAVSGLTTTASVGGSTVLNPGATQFLMTFTDPNGNTPNQGTVNRGASSELNGSDGLPMAGFFAPFRAALTGGPSGGANSSLTNGVFDVGPDGRPRAGLISGSRNQTSGPGNPTIVGTAGDGTDTGTIGRASLDGMGNIVGGDYADIYRFIYFPKPDFSPNADRLITVDVRNLNLRYIFGVNGNSLSVTTQTANTVNFNGSFSFQVPTPGATALLGLAGLAAARRRRA
ncbi:MAG: hypothetical protein ACT4PL_01525 [Phycisphaerales bacterium]